LRLEPLLVLEGEERSMTDLMLRAFSANVKELSFNISFALSEAN
jgi:hypothetical protein